MAKPQKHKLTTKSILPSSGFSEPAKQSHIAVYGYI